MDSLDSYVRDGVAVDPSQSRVGSKGATMGLPPEQQLPELGKLDQETMLRHVQRSRDIHAFKRNVSALLLPSQIQYWGHHAATRAGALDMFGTFPESMTREYKRQQFHSDDLMLYLASPHNDSPLLFQEDIDRYVLAAPFYRQEAVINLAISQLYAQSGITSYCAIFIEDAERGNALVRLASRTLQPPEFRDFVLENFEKLRLLCGIVNQVGWRKFPKKFHSKVSPEMPIAARPLELLSVLIKKDLTLNEAAEVLNISISTANQHIAAAKKALGAHTMHATIVAALDAGFIDRNI